MTAAIVGCWCGGPGTGACTCVRLCAGGDKMQSHACASGQVLWPFQRWTVDPNYLGSNFTSDFLALCL